MVKARANHNNYSRGEVAKTTCSSCGTFFLNPSGQAKWCPGCKKAVKSAQRRINGEQHFRAIDGEGVGRGSDHKYVLLGVGQNQVQWENGVKNIEDIFGFLYQQFKLDTNRIFGGFYLTYDWNMWLRLLPRERVWRLLSDRGIISRLRRESPVPFPVRYNGWEFDMLWGKRFKLRPEGTPEWLYINDFGPFFQTSLLKALATHPTRCNLSDDDFAKIVEGKEKRASASLDEDMCLYNRLENRACEELMEDLSSGFRKLGVKLGKTEFHGPGQAAQKWAEDQRGIILCRDAVLELPPSLQDDLVKSYYGGIFEILAHGHIPGTSYEYDINSAYPNAMVNLPCLCGEWSRGVDGDLTLYRCVVWGSDRRFGPLPFRTPQRTIRRPMITKGWYWKHEIEAAQRAGLIRKINVVARIGYTKCQHPNPVAGLKSLYETRIRLGKESSLGKAMKLIYNSLYGKFAQSIGNPKVANVVFASLITSMCRTTILDAISTHPNRTRDLLMVATDAVFFSSPHPHLNLSNRLGDWEKTELENLTIFKPGMYWDDNARAAIAAGNDPVFKSRGVSARDFKKWIAEVDAQFRLWEKPGGVPYLRLATPEDHTRWKKVPENWPTVKFPMGFNQISVKAALRWTEEMDNPAAQIAKYRNAAGVLREGVEVTQTSDPSSKRTWLKMREDYDLFGDGIWRSRARSPIFGMVLESTPYDKRFGMPEEPGIFEEEHGGIDEPLDIAYFQALNLR
jgi:hypothetical protein